MREQLFINGVEIPLSRSLDPSFTKAIIDIKSPEKRGAAYSKSVTVPNSKEAAKVFGFVFEINRADSTFNPNLKADCLYLVDGNEQIRGYCQLKDLIKTNNHDIEYSIVMFSEFADLFKEIQNKWLDEITGLDTYDHIINRQLQNYSTNQSGVEWFIIEDGALVAGEYGKGYIYPLIDYGFSTDATTFKVTDIGCSIYALEYWNRIFADAGYTYEFTDTAFADHFKHLIIPSSPETYLLDADEIADRQFQSNTPNFTSTGTTTSNNITKGTYSAEDVIIYTNEISDAGGVYDPLTGIFTCTSSGWYTFASTIDTTVYFIPSSGASVNSVGYVEFISRIIFYDDSAATSYIVAEDGFKIRHDGFSSGTRQSDPAPTFPSDDYFVGEGLIETPRVATQPNRMQILIENQLLAVGDQIKVVWTANYKTDYPNYFVDGGGSFTNGNARVDISVGSFFNKVTNLGAVEGNILKVSKCIPKVKQADFLLNYIKEYNLYFDIDVDTPNHFLISPRDSFYTTNVIDLSNKVAIDKGITIEPIGALDAKSYLFKHKDDVDYLNERYKSKWLETYGQREIIVVNDFNQKENKTEVSSSPTPLSDSGNNAGMVIPTIIKIDDLGQKISTASNWRTLYYGGQKSIDIPWKHEGVAFGYEYFSTYPYAGHFDDPFNPTLDINFGLVREVYYNDIYAPIVVTDNNLYNKYHSKFIREITDKDSKIVKCYVDITPFNYSQWKFSDLYYFERSYFILNKIEGFNPTNNELTKCEFLKLKEVSPFEPTLTAADGDGVPFEPTTQDGTTSGQINQQEYMPLKGITEGIKQDTNNYNSQSGTVSGTGNLISQTSYRVSITGNNNTVLGSSQNINLMNSSGNVIGSGLENVTLINSNNLTISESNVTYMNGVKVNGSALSSPSAVSEISASQFVETDVKTYIVDTSAGNISITFNITGTQYTEGQIWYFKKISASNSMNIKTNAGTIDGLTTQSFSALNDYVAVQYCGGIILKII